MLSVLALAGETHPFTVHDMLAMQRISDPQASPDGRTIAFVVRTTDLEANRGRTDIWLVPTAGGEPRRLTTDPANDWNPRWAPDGASLYFLSTRSGSAQVHRIPLAGGEARQVTRLPLDVGALAVSPDGARLAVALEVFPDCEDLACTTRRLDERASRKASGRIYDRLFVRHWDTWKDGRRAHLFVLPASGKGTAVDVMRGMDADCPTKPFGGPEDFTFTPDGREIVFSARNVGHEEAWSTDFDLYAVPVDGSQAPRELTADNPAWDAQPVFSPDGSTLAWLAMERAGYESDRFRIMLRAWPDGAPRVLTADWDRSPRALSWTRDGRALLATADDIGQHALFRIDAREGTVRRLWNDGTASSPVDTGHGIVFGIDSLAGPVELHRLDPAAREPVALTALNAERVAAARMGTFEQFSFAGWNGETVYGYLVRPADFDPALKYPVAFLIHGGPQGSFGNHFHYRWNPQAYAGHGFAAVMIDFHGSTGYGQAFTDSIRGDWGGKPLEDLQKGLAAALERYPFLDGDRVCALGASFGGFMINWIAGQWPDRFECLVNHDGNLDERFAYFDTEELWFPEWDHMGTPWENPEGYEKHNPIRFVDRWKTPMLVIHGAKDYRVVDTQGLGTFNALQRRGIPSRLLYFPDENHWVLKPHNSILWHETVLAWLDRWTGRKVDP
ncbi:MAG: S9 family peptidase [Acidobacteria bacterium]|nr:MAG: S9 family peptidase [Acidobacteriota bacterium]